MRYDYLDAYHLAIEMVKKAGFVLSHVSQTSESCYYYHPGRGKEYLLRLSAHKSKHAPMGMRSVVAKVSFTPRQWPKPAYHTIYNNVAFAIGRYFLEDHRPQEYKGKKGTWENLDELVE